MKKNHMLWIIALIIVNSGWYVVTQQSASQEINRPGADFSGERDAEITALIGSNSDYELVHCFESINGGIYNVSIRIEMDSEILYSWSGDTSDDCVSFSSSSDEGTITIITEIEEGAESTTTFNTWPLEGALIPGILVFSLGTLLLAYGETIVRSLIRKKLEKIDNMAIEQAAESATTPSIIWQDPVRPE
tara:strand:+ start:415 stop:984 length:570 start_codon:yes stop_codon:yes gene_type:complete